MRPQRIVHLKVKQGGQVGLLVKAMMGSAFDRAVRSSQRTQHCVLEQCLHADALPIQVKSVRAQRGSV